MATGMDVSDSHCTLCNLTFAYPSKLKRHLLSSDHQLFEANIKKLEESILDVASSSDRASDIERARERLLLNGTDLSSVDHVWAYETIEEEDLVEKGVCGEMTYADDDMNSLSCENLSFEGMEDSNSDYEGTLEDNCFAEIVEIDSLSSNDFFPFSSQVEAVMFMLLHSPRPLGEKNLKFIYHGFKIGKRDLPSLHQLKNLQLPNYEPPKTYLTDNGRPFYVNSITSLISNCLADYSIASKVSRMPTDGCTAFRQLYEAKKWNSESRFQAVTVIHNNEKFFVHDFVKLNCVPYGIIIARLNRFYQKDDGNIFVDITPVLTSRQYCQSSYPVPLNTDDSCNFILDTASVQISSVLHIVNFHPMRLLKLENGHVSELSLNDSRHFLYPCSMRGVTDGKPVLVLPIVLYTDDLSGNRTKKWNKFDCWAFLLAGLPKEMNTSHENIHFICASNRVTCTEMAKPIVEELLVLEKGVFMFDAYWKEDVFVMVHVFAVICDNPRASEVTGHMTGKPRKYCRYCLCDCTLDIMDTSVPRCKQQTVQICSAIANAVTVKRKDELKTAYGLTGIQTPLFKLELDLHQCTPIECLHTILLGPYKYLLRHVMSKFSVQQKAEIEARLNVFPYSGFKNKLKTNICRYVGSMLGRDFKLFAQLALYIVGPYLNEEELKVWLSLSKIFVITYIKEVNPSDIDYYREITQDFVLAVRNTYPHLSSKAKIHLLLHLPDSLLQFGPTMAYNTERCESFNSLIRTQNIYSNRLSPSRDIAISFNTLECLRHVGNGGYLKDGLRAGNGLIELFQSAPVQSFLNSTKNENNDSIYTHGDFCKIARDSKKRPIKSTLDFSVTMPVVSNSASLLCGTKTPAVNLSQELSQMEIVEEGTMYKAVMGSNGRLISTGDCVQLMTDNQVHYGILVSCLEISKEKVCVVRLFDELNIMNEYDCPLLTLITSVSCVTSTQIIKSVSILHNCIDCCFEEAPSSTIIERRLVEDTHCKYSFVHKYDNNMYYLNVYCA